MEELRVVAVKKNDEGNLSKFKRTMVVLLISTSVRLCVIVAN